MVDSTRVGTMFSDNLLQEDGILLFLSYRAPLSRRAYFSPFFFFLSFFFSLPLVPFFSSLFSFCLFPPSLSFSLFRNNAISISISRDRFAGYLFLKPSSRRLNYVRHPGRFDLPENSANFSLSLSLSSFHLVTLSARTLHNTHCIIADVALCGARKLHADEACCGERARWNFGESPRISRGPASTLRRAAISLYRFSSRSI